MPEPHPPLALLPGDARRAVFRTRDAVRAALSRAGLPVELGGTGEVEVGVSEPEVAMPVAGLARALAEAAVRPSAHLVPGGGFSGARFPAEETYVTSWELQLLAEERAAGPARTAPGPKEAPARVRSRGGESSPESLRPWLVHSFSGRKGHARPNVLALVPASARTVLDVGCGEGALGASLQARGVLVTGIELDAQAAAVAAQRLSRVFTLSAEAAVSVLDVRPDVVVLADVLEHLADPVAVLRALREALSPGGRLVFSVPNATHASVLGGAFRGRWDRELEGIVADDHRTYSGREGWTALLAACGFRVTALKAETARTNLSEGDRRAFLSSTRLTPDDLDAVQWLGMAERSAPGAGSVTSAAVEDDGPLGGEDPVGTLAMGGGEGQTPFVVRNATCSGVVETLLEGGLVTGEAAAAFLSGWTRTGLVNRFEGSGLDVRVSPFSTEPVAGAVQAVVDSRRATGVPTDEVALAAASWSVTFRPARR